MQDSPAQSRVRASHRGWGTQPLVLCCRQVGLSVLVVQFGQEDNTVMEWQKNKRCKWLN